MIISAPVRYLDRASPPHISTLIILSALSALAMNMFLPSLPGMTRYFNTEYSVMQLSVALFLAVNAALQIFIGPLSDFFGRRPILLWSIFLFMLATLGCIFAPNATVFLVFRMAQAVIVAGMALSRAIVRDIVSAAESARMISYVTMGMAVAPMIAPALGGVLDDAFGWKGSFWALFLVGLAALVLSWHDLGETKPRAHGTRFRDQLREYPELLMARRFWGYALSAALASGAFFAYVGGAPFVGSEILGLSPAVLGLFFGAPALGYMVGNGVSARYTMTLGLGRTLLIGAVTSTSGVALTVLFYLTGEQTAIEFFGFMMLVGIGNGMVLPNATAGLVSVRPHLAGTASGLGGAIMIGGGAALSALAGALLSTDTGATPLLMIMLISNLGSIAAVLYTNRREREVAT